MNKNKNPFAISNKISRLLTKKELELARHSSSDNIKLHSSHRLNQYIKLVRKLRDKYLDLTQRQKVAKRNTESFRTIEKAKFFKKVLSAYEKQSKKVKAKRVPNKTQLRLDHEQHYDIDGVTQKDHKVIIPSNSQIQKSALGRN